jgi:hypothetical protein
MTRTVLCLKHSPTGEILLYDPRLRVLVSNQNTMYPLHRLATLLDEGWNYVQEPEASRHAQKRESMGQDSAMFKGIVLGVPIGFVLGCLAQAVLTWTRVK